MNGDILILNFGSSSIKFGLYDGNAARWHRSTSHITWLGRVAKRAVQSRLSLELTMSLA